MTGREKRESEKILDSVYNAVRGLDKLLWNGQQWAVIDIEDYVWGIKKNLDEVVKQFKKEVKYEDTTTCCGGGCGCHDEENVKEPFIDPPLVDNKEWKITPTVVSIPLLKNG